MQHGRFAGILLAVCCAVARSGFAASLVDWSAIDTWAGSGSQRAAVVIDWNDGSGADTLRWGFRWDSAPASVADLLLALEAADAHLDIRFTDFGGALGLFVDGIGFDAEASTPADYGGPFDHLRDRNGGWANTFSFWYGAAADAAWSESLAGISSTPISDNQVFGFAWNAAGAFPAPPPPVVPEPGSLALWGLGLAALAVRKPLCTR